MLAGMDVQFEDTSTGAVRSRRWDFGDGGTSRSASPRRHWSSPGFYKVTLTVGDGTRESTASRTFQVESAEPQGTCEGDSETLCLRDSRFEVTVEWWTAGGPGGPATIAFAGTNDSGMFRFFDRDNWEILVKVLDGCELNGHVWVFAAATTTLGYAIRVTDTAMSATREYRSEPGSPARAVADVKAFPVSCRPP